MLRIFLLTLFLSIWGTLASAAAAPSVAGDWDGILDAHGISLYFVLHIRSLGSQGYEASLDNVDQDVNGVPAEGVTVQGNTVTVRFRRYMPRTEGFCLLMDKR